MKLVAVTVYLAFCLAVGVDSASVSLSSNTLTLNGNAHIQFYEPKEEIWNGLTNGHRYPIINSGDQIALRMAYTSGTLSVSWLYCAYTCSRYTCPGAVLTASKWNSCSNAMKYVIKAMGKMDGQPINSGDIVSLSSVNYGSSRRLYCSSSTSTKCYLRSSVSSMQGNSWLSYIYDTFQIFSRNAVDGTPVQYGDVVGFKYMFAGNSNWLYYYNSYFYAKSCSTNSKTSCARENYPAGFRIFKKL